MEKPVDMAPNSFLSGLTHHAADELSLPIKNDCAGHDVARAYAGEHVGIAADAYFHCQLLLTPARQGREVRRKAFLRYSKASA
jgi:hypothetical protein